MRLSQAPQCVTFREQRYDFSRAELTTVLDYRIGDTTARLEVLQFCSHQLPTIALQEIRVTVDRAADLAVSVGLDPTGVEGFGEYVERPSGKVTPDQPEGLLVWHSHGDVSTCGLAYRSELLGTSDATQAQTKADERGMVATEMDVPGAGRTPVPGPPDELARAEHRPSSPGRPCRATPGACDGQGLGPDARGPAHRLGGAMASADRDRWGGSALAGDHRREPLLPADLGPPRVDRQHVAVRPRLLAELPLLPRPRDVGHRDVRPAPALPRRARVGEGHPGLPIAPPRGRPGQRPPRRLEGRDVPVGELPDARRGGHARVERADQGPRHARRRPGLRRPSCTPRATTRLPPADGLAGHPCRRRMDGEPRRADAARL